MNSSKSDWRRQLLAARSAIPAEVRKDHERAIVERARRLRCFERAASVLGYDAIGAEVDPSGLMAWAGRHGADVFTPTVTATDAGALWATWPAADAASMRSLDALRYPIVVIAPGVGYDGRGNRLGRGQGFYDRVLALLQARDATTVVAPAFECQLVSQLPVDPWDRRVDTIVTERRVLDFAGHVAAEDGGLPS